mgnify:CR=1 FL=1
MCVTCVLQIAFFHFALLPHYCLSTGCGTSGKADERRCHRQCEQTMLALDSLAYRPTHSLAYSRAYYRSTNSLTCSLTCSLTHSLTHSGEHHRVVDEPMAHWLPRAIRGTGRCATCSCGWSRCGGPCQSYLRSFTSEWSRRTANDAPDPPQPTLSWVRDQVHPYNPDPHLQPRPHLYSP